MSNGFLFKLEKQVNKKEPGTYFVKALEREVEEKMVLVSENFDELKNNLVFFVFINLIKKQKKGLGTYEVIVDKKIKLNKGIEDAVEDGEIYMLLNKFYKVILQNNNGDS